MDASWMYVANYFREISEAHGSIEMEKVRNEALRLVGISRRAARGARWDAVFVGVCLRLSGYSCPQSPDADAYRGFGRPLGDQPGRGSVVVLADDAFSGGTTRVGFLEEADGDSVKVIEAVEDLNIVISTYDRARILDYRWPIEATGLPHGTSLPTIASISPENTPLSVKFAMGTVEPLRMAEAPDFAYWDRTGETLHGVEGHEAAAPAPAVIESVVIGPVLRREEGRAPRLVEIARAAEPPRIRSTVRGSRTYAMGISSGTGVVTLLESRLAADTLVSPQLLGPEVAALQCALAADRFDLGGIDGVFGRRTRDAVLAVQSQCGLPLTGFADDETWKALSVGAMRVPHFEFVSGMDAGRVGTVRVSHGPARGLDQEGGASALAPERVPLYFATTRRPAGGDQSTEFTDERRRELAFGSITVSVPALALRPIGSIPRPKEWLRIGKWVILGQSEDENKHFVIKARNRLTRKEFCEAVGGNASEHALVFVHGFNTTFEDAACRLAQIVSDLQFDGVPILFAWPSRGTKLGYWYDRESAMFSREAFLELVKVLQAETRLKTVHVIAHSMGNQIVVDALASLGSSYLGRSKSLAEVILAAPDVDRDVFRDLAGRIKEIARGVTLYASQSDRALQVSRGIAQFPRAGDVPAEGPVVVPNVDTIDASAVGSELLSLNHSKFATDRSLIDDLNRLIRLGDRPPNIRSAQIIGIPTSGAPTYWRYRD